MSRSKTLGLSMLFLAIAIVVSGSLVVTIRGGYAVNGGSPAVPDAIHLLQRT